MPVKHIINDGEYRLAEWPCTSGHFRMEFNAEVSTHLLLLFGLSAIEIWSYFLITELLLPVSSHFNLWDFLPKYYKAMLLSFIKITSLYYHNLGLAALKRQIQQRQYMPTKLQLLVPVKKAIFCITGLPS